MLQCWWFPGFGDQVTTNTITWIKYGMSTCCKYVRARYDIWCMYVLKYGVYVQPCYTTPTYFLKKTKKN